MSVRQAIYIVLMQEMADLTLPECKTACRAPLSCCDPLYCEITKGYAQDKFGITLEQTDHPTLPFMGQTGCTVLPYLRPLCTLHTCDVNSLGFKKNDPVGEWNDTYFTLCERIEQLSSEL